MRRRGLAAVPLMLVSLALGAPAAQADDALRMYRVTVDQESVQALSELGVDLGHTGYRPSVKRAQTIFVDLIDSQAAAARADGLALQELTPGPHVTETRDREAARGGGRSRTRGAGQAGDGRRLAEPVLRRLPLLLGAGRRQERDDRAGRGASRTSRSSS